MDKAALLEKLENQIKACQNCELCKTALNAVPGEGNPNAELMFVGEAPGATEDATGRPFVGRAGKLLDLLLKEIGYKRQDVWIGNVIKHRPPNNRDPLPAEILACEGYLTAQIKIINPKLIVPLGRFGMYYFYKAGKITNDHGKLIFLPTYPIYPVYHPAAALRNPEFLRALKTDFLRIPAILTQLSQPNPIKKTKLGF